MKIEGKESYGWQESKFNQAQGRSATYTKCSKHYYSGFILWFPFPRASKVYPPNMDRKQTTLPSCLKHFWKDSSPSTKATQYSSWIRVEHHLTTSPPPSPFELFLKRPKDVVGTTEKEQRQQKKVIATITRNRTASYRVLLYYLVLWETIMLAVTPWWSIEACSPAIWLVLLDRTGDQWHITSEIHLH